MQFDTKSKFNEKVSLRYIWRSQMPLNFHPVGSGKKSSTYPSILSHQHEVNMSPLLHSHMSRSSIFNLLQNISPSFSIRMHQFEDPWRLWNPQNIYRRASFLGLYLHLGPQSDRSRIRKVTSHSYLINVKASSYCKKHIQKTTGSGFHLLGFYKILEVVHQILA